MRGSPVFTPNFIQICSYIIEKIIENRQKRSNIGSRPVRSNPGAITSLRHGKDKKNKIFNVGNPIELHVSEVSGMCYMYLTQLIIL